MIFKDKASRLIEIYMYICDMYEQSLKYHCQNRSNNSKPRFSDEEILTITSLSGRSRITRKSRTPVTLQKSTSLIGFLGWYPNRHSATVRTRCQGQSRHLLDSHKPEDCENDTLIVDTFPVMTCTGRNRMGRCQRDSGQGNDNQVHCQKFSERIHDERELGFIQGVRPLSRN